MYLSIADSNLLDEHNTNLLVMISWSAVTSRILMFPKLAGGKGTPVQFLMYWGPYKPLAVNGAVRKREPVCTRNSCVW